MRKLLRPLFRTASSAYGTLARTMYPRLRLPPIRLSLMVTRRCNLSCPYCYEREELNRPETERLSRGEWKRIIDRIPRYMLVMIGGGEPFAHVDTDWILDCLLDTRHHVSVVTNGTLLKDETVSRLVAKRLRYLMVSLDGMSEYHDGICGVPGSFNRIRTLFEQLNNEKEMAGARYPLTCIKTTVTEDNFSQLPQLMTFVEDELKADHMSFSLIVQNPLQEGFKMARDLNDPRAGHGNSYRYPKQVLPQIKDMIERVHEYSRESRMQIEIAPQFKTGDVPSYLEKPELYGVGYCPIPWIEFSLYYDGTIAPCVTCVVSNIRDLAYDVTNVVRSSEYARFLGDFEQISYPAPCEGCCWGRHEKK